MSSTNGTYLNTAHPPALKKMAEPSPALAVARPYPSSCRPPPPLALTIRRRRPEAPHARACRSHGSTCSRATVVAGTVALRWDLAAAARSAMHCNDRLRLPFLPSLPLPLLIYLSIPKYKPQAHRSIIAFSLKYSKVYYQIHKDLTR